MIRGGEDEDEDEDDEVDDAGRGAWYSNTNSDCGNRASRAMYEP